MVIKTCGKTLALKRMTCIQVFHYILDIRTLRFKRKAAFGQMKHVEIQ